MFALASLLAPIACSPPAADSGRPATEYADHDGDGYWPVDDCDDLDAAVHPGAVEVCNGWDDDCDGTIDDADVGLAEPVAWYADADGDGVGAGAATYTCRRPEGHTTTDGDCDDADPASFPGAAEGCDGIDNDCDGALDEACGPVPLGEVLTDELVPAVRSACMDYLLSSGIVVADVDGDGLSDVTTTSTVCAPPGVVGLRGPFATTADLSEAALLRAESFAFDAGVDVTGDGVGDWVFVGGDSSTTGLVARLFAGPLLGGERDEDALLTVQLDPGRWGEPPNVGTPRLVPGGPGGFTLTLGYEPVQDEGYMYASFLVDASRRGSIGTDDTTTLLVGGSSPGRASEVCARAGDLDGDGSVDLATTNGERIQVFLGPHDPFQYRRLAELSLEASRSVYLPSADGTAAGDLDGDGRDDLVLFAQADDPEPAEILRTRVRDDGALAIDEGSPVVVAGADTPSTVTVLDRDADGAVDLAIGIPDDGTRHLYAGSVYVFSGPFEGPRELGDASLSVFCPDRYCSLGRGLGAGDTNGDGFDDLVIGGYPVAEGAAFAWVALGGAR